MAKREQTASVGLVGLTMTTDPRDTWRQELVQLFETMIVETNIASRHPDGKTLQYPAVELPINAIERLFRYGGQRYPNDAVGGSDTEPAAKVIAAQAIIDNLKAGIVGRIARETVDSLTMASREQARRELKLKHSDIYKRLRAALKTESLTRDDYNAKLDKIVENNPNLVEKAKAVLAAKAEAVIGGLDISDVEL